MITGEIKSQVDRLWDAFWSGGISNPLEVIEQITYLLFIKRLDDLHTTEEKKANRLKIAIEKAVFAPNQEHLRWSKFNPSTSIKSYFSGNIPWITSSDITCPIVNLARNYITEEAIANSATNLVKEGTILLVTRTGVGKVAIAGTSLCFSQDITAILPDSKVLHPKCLSFFLNTKESYFKQNQRGATIKGITREVISNLLIPIPPFSKQQHIANILYKVDKLRDNQLQSKTKQETLFLSLQQRAFSGELFTQQANEELNAATNEEKTGQMSLFDLMG